MPHIIKNSDRCEGDIIMQKTEGGENSGEGKTLSISQPRTIFIHMRQ